MKEIKTRVYCCGGAGTNIGQLINSAHLTNCYIDTSNSNRTDNIDPGNVYRIEGVDGSGANPRQNYQIIHKNLGAILERFEPSDFNIVLFAAAGGSGSVLGPLLMRHLLKEGKTAVAVVVGSDDSARACTNTINTIKSLENMSLSNEKPLVMYYTTNTVGVPRGTVDQEVLFALEALGELSSQTNAELDTMDVHNWINYHKVCSAHPQLSTLFVADSRQEANSVLEPISIASLWPEPDAENPFGSPQYTTRGFPRGKMAIAEQLHFVINHVGVVDVFKSLADRQEELNRKFSTYQRRKALVDVDDSTEDDGMVF